MTSRTCKLNALAFSTTGYANIQVTINGSTVFSNRFPATLTSNTPSDDVRGNTENFRHNQLFEFELDPALSGNITLNISVTEGTLYFTSILSNYAAEVIKIAAVEKGGKLAWEDVTNNSAYNNVAYTSDEVFLRSRSLPTVTAGAVHKMIYAAGSKLVTRDLATTLLEEFVPLSTAVKEDGLLVSDNISNAVINGVACERIDPWFNCIAFKSDADKAIPLFKFEIPVNGSFECTYTLPSNLLINPNLDLETQIKSLPLTTYLDPFSDHNMNTEPVFH